ncbi:MAG: zinc-binding dehydrogenase [Armatimonadota bacterium]|nr:zinc-binding dehydrogenase [Armatimonadota bacterium]
MKILQVTAPGEFKILEQAVPEAGPGEALVKVLAVTTCPQWDLHLSHNEPMFVGHQFRYPYTPGQPGHEMTGEVVAVGPDVLGLEPGDRVSAWRDPGSARPGCYAQYVVHRTEDLIRVPAHLPGEATAPLELAMCVGAVFLMFRTMGGIEGKRFAVSGLGPAGLIALQMARAEGASSVTGFDLSEARRQMGLSLGLDKALDPRTLSQSKAPERPAPIPFDCAVDCVGAKASVEFLMDQVKDIVALFGVQREPYEFQPRHWMGGLRLCGYKGHSRAAAEYAVDLIEQGQLQLSPLSTHNLPLESYGEAIRLLETQEAVKVCFWPWR